MMMIFIYFKSTTWITTRTEAPASIYVDPATTSSLFYPLVHHHEGMCVQFKKSI